MPLPSDVRFAGRMLLRAPLTTAAAVLTLALGIGGTTAVFSVVDTILLRPLPYGHAERLVAVWATSRLGNRGGLSPADSLDFRRETQAFEGMAAVTYASMPLTGAGTPEQIRVQSVSGGFFTLLGAHAVAGRTFGPEDDHQGSPDRLVISEQLWRARFAGRPDVVGRTVALGGIQVEIIGVAAAPFRFRRPADAWLLGYRGVPRVGAVRGDLTTNRDVHILQVVGRLAPGVSARSAQAELDAHAARLAREFPETNAGYGVTVESLHEALVGDTRPVLIVLLGAIAALLAIAAVNVANLMLVRTGQRAAELGIRSALGAPRGTIARLILVEAALIAALGGLLGFGLASWGVQALASLAPPNLPRIDEVSVDGRVLLVGLLLTALTTAVFGAWPALRASRVDVARLLAGAGRTSAGPDRRRAQYWLVGGELALAQVLLVIAGLLVVSFSRLVAVDPGIVTHGLVGVDVSLAREKYGTDPARKEQFHQAVLDRVGGLPGVAGVAMSLTAPLSAAINRGVVIDGRPVPGPENRQTMSFVPISEGYFELLGIAVRRGRGITARDTEGSERVVVVNEAFVRRYLEGSDPLTQRIGFGDPKSATYWRRVVGVVEDAREQVAQPAPPTAYIPFRQDREPWNFATYTIRTALPVAALEGAVQESVLSVDPDQPVSRVRTLEEALAGGVAVERFTAMLAALFAGLSLTLAGVGAFGVITHAVSARRRELGVRLAVGASHGAVVRLIVYESLRVILPATALGVAGAAAAGRWMQSLLYDTAPIDVPTIAAGAGVLLLTALVATYLPVRRALGSNPLSSLRD